MMKNYLNLLLLMTISLGIMNYAHAQEDLEYVLENLEDIIGEKKEKNIRTSWLLINAGFNTFLKEDVPLVDRVDVTELKAIKSFNWGIEFVQLRINLYKHHLNLKTGLGSDYRSYEFANVVQLSDKSEKVEFDLINSVGTTKWKKNNLYAAHLKIPLMLSYETRPDKMGKSFRINAGGYGSLRFNSRVKQKWDNRTLVIKDGFKMNRWDYGLSGSVGYSWINVYCNYSLAGLFKSDLDNGYILTPLSIGVQLYSL